MESYIKFLLLKVQISSEFHTLEFTTQTKNDTVFQVGMRFSRATFN